MKSRMYKAEKEEAEEGWVEKKEGEMKSRAVLKESGEVIESRPGEEQSNKRNPPPSPSASYSILSLRIHSSIVFLSSIHCSNHPFDLQLVFAVLLLSPPPLLLAWISL